MLVAKEINTSRTHAQSELWRSPALLGGLTSVLLVLVFHLSIYNRYLPIQEGWFSYYGYLMQHGKFPYRDFYFFTQPISLLITRCIVACGDNFIYFRYYGMAERALVTGALYYLLSRYFTVPAAVYATVASSFLLTSYCADAFFSYLYTCLLFSIAALIFLARAVSSATNARINLMITGVLSSLSFFSKQSNGLFVIAAVLLAINVLNQSTRSACRNCLYVLVGVTVGALPIFLWLLWGGALPQYIDEVYRGAASSKGSLTTILFGFYSRALQPFALLTFAALLIKISHLIRKHGLAKGSDLHAGPRVFTALLGMSLALAVGLATVPRAVPSVETGLTIVTSRWLIRVAFYITFSCFFWILWQRIAKRRVNWAEGYELPIILAIASFCWTYTCGSSYVVEEHSAIPSVAMIVAFSYDKLRFNSPERGHKIIASIAIFIVVLSVWHKSAVAFNWQSWLEPVSTESRHSAWEPIADYKLDTRLTTMYDTILNDISDNVKEGEQVVTFPFMPMFNVITHHPQPTFAPVHYWDVCPDYIAAADAVRVKRARPKMIINILMPEQIWDIHERGFRSGRLSGQRKFQNVINELTSSGGYRLLAVYLTPYYHDPVCVWLRL